MRWPRWWPQARAVLLSTAVAGSLMQAIPFPRKPIPDEERSEWRAKDVDLWYRWLSATGAVGSREDFQEQVVDGYLLLRDVGDWAQAPVRPYFRATRTTQQWGLFAVVTEKPERLVVDIEIDGEWRRIAARLKPEHPWEDERFKYRRVRGTWDTIKPDQPAPLYEAFCRWTARRAFEDYPEAQRVRVRRERFSVAAPWEEVDPKIVANDERILERGEATLWALR